MQHWGAAIADADPLLCSVQQCAADPSSVWLCSPGIVQRRSAVCAVKVQLQWRLLLQQQLLVGSRSINTCCWALSCHQPPAPGLLPNCTGGAPRCTRCNPPTTMTKYQQTPVNTNQYQLIPILTNTSTNQCTQEQGIKNPPICGVWMQYVCPATQRLQAPAIKS